MTLTLSFQTRRELLQQMIPRYRVASIAPKGALLNEIAATAGYTRRYAMWLLNHREAGHIRFSAAATAIWTRGPTRPVSGLARGQSDL